MTKETVKKLYEHFDKVSKGDYGMTNNPVRNNLIKSDALNNKLKLEEKFPELLKSVPEPKPKQETKSKGKK